LEKDQRHPVTGGDANQFAGCTAFAKLRGRSHHFIKLLQDLPLLVHKQLGVTNHVQKQNVSSLEMEL
jgi:hypothetical protein